MKEKIVVIGGGGHAKVLINILKRLNKYQILGYADLMDKGVVQGLQYLGNDGILNGIIKNNKKCSAVIGVGNVRISDTRRKIYKMLKNIGFDLPVIISPNAIVSDDVIIDEGTAIFDGAIINSGTIIGKCVTVNNAAIVEYDCKIGDFVHLTPCTILSFGVEVGNSSFIGSGAIISQNIKIAENCLIGGGSVVIKDALLEGTYLGVPSRYRILK